MKNLSAKIATMSLLTLVVLTFALPQQASATQLERIEWIASGGQNDILSLKLDDHPGYVLSESGGGNIIELILKETALSKNINRLEPRGIVKSSVALAEGKNVKIQFLLSTMGSANIEPVDSGFRISIKSASQANQAQQASQAQQISASSVDATPSANKNGGRFSDLRFSRMSGDRVQVYLKMEGQIKDPAVFKTVEPSRIAFDFLNVKNTTGKSVFPIGISAVGSAVVAQDDNRMRIVVNLLNPVDYRLTKVETGYVLTLGASASASTAASVFAGAIESEESDLPQALSGKKKPSAHSIESVDFRRTPNGGGRIIIKLSDPEVAVDLQELGSEIIAVFADTSIPGELEQRLDVIDFATPVSYVDTYADGRHAKLVVSMGGRFRQSSVQSDSTLVLDVSPLTLAEEEVENIDEFGFKGDTLSLNFQEIDVRAALQVLADFTGLNFIASDDVSGNLSLRLKDVPWDQALDVILKTEGLAMRQTGNVIRVAPAEEIASQEIQALEAKQEAQELEPLVSALIRVSYAKVEDIADLLKSVKAVKTGFAQGFGSVTVNEIKTEKNSLLSERGSVTVDSRTNSILVQDIASKIKEIKAMIVKLDIPVRQVQIETRIVEANDDFSKNIGARLGFTRIAQQVRLPGSKSSIGDVFSSGSIENTNQVRAKGVTEVNDDALSVNLPAGSIGGDSAGSYAFTIAKLGSGFLHLLDLELSALQAEGKGKIIANPKILTTDKHSANIEQGQERLTTFGSAFGTSSTQGQRAVLSLTVLPQITPDDKVILDVDIANDSFVAANVDTVNTKRITTQALLENGETVVIGGIYTQDETYSITKIPFFGDIPFIGTFFRKKTSRNNRSELLIFLTPRIIDPALAVQ